MMHHMRCGSVMRIGIQGFNKAFITLKYDRIWDMVHYNVG